ncbi:tetratricopeptide repeat protein [Chloroflexota bacterium]
MFTQGYEHFVMPIEDEKLLRHKQQRGEQAIGLAMQGRWREAAEANREILETFPDEVDACNRLGRAYIELGEREQAQEAYSRALQIDPYNSIAKKNLQKLAYWEDAAKPAEPVEGRRLAPQHFIEEIGKSAVTALQTPAAREVLARIHTGEPVYLRAEGVRLIAESEGGTFLGQVEPRQAQRLIRLIEGGNRYSAAVINVTESTMSIIIREEYQHPDQAGRISFPPRGPEEMRPFPVERVLKVEESDSDESGFTVIGGDEVEVLPEESGGEDEDEMALED